MPQTDCCQQHQARAQPQAHKLLRRIAQAKVFLQLRNQVSQRHINKAACSHDQHIRHESIKLLQEDKAQDAAADGAGTGHDEFENRRFERLRIAAQDDQVAHVVRHFVGKNRQRRHGAQSGAADGGSGNQHAVAHAMHDIAQEDGQAPAAAVVAVGVVMRMRVAVAIVNTVAVFVAMVIQLGFAKQKENN